MNPSLQPVPAAATLNPDNLREKLLADLGGDDPVIMAFSNLSYEDIKRNIRQLIHNAIIDKPPEIRKHALQQIHLTIQDINVNPTRVRMMLEILSSLVKDNVLSGREACECLKELLNTEIENMSIELLDFFDVLIDCTDYKIVKEIFTNCLQETSKLPSILDGSHHRISNKINSMLVKLLDRKNLVLPPICSYCDIMTAFNKPNVYPHWSVSQLLNDYVATFNCLTDLMTIENVEALRPVVRHSLFTQPSWRLDQQTLTFYSANPSVCVLRFAGPYGAAQENLVLYSLKQINSRDLIFSTMLGLRQGKQQICPILERLFISFIKDVCHLADKNDNTMYKMKVWERVGGELSSLIFANAVNIKHIIEALYEEIKQPQHFLLFQRNRDFIMWTISRCFSFGLRVVKLHKKEFLFVGDMIKLLYLEQKPLQIPDLTSPLSVIYFSAGSLWALFSTRTHDNPGLQDPVPIALVEHLKFLQSNAHHFKSFSDFTVSIMLNYANNFTINVSDGSCANSRSLLFLMESVYQNVRKFILPGNVTAPGAIHPIPLLLLNTFTSHAKLNLMLTVTQYIMKMSDREDRTYGPQSPLPPALLETYSRLLSTIEIDFVSLKMFTGSVLMSVFNNQAISILTSLMEMYCYRLSYVKQCNYRVQILIHLQQLVNIANNKTPQPQLLYHSENHIIMLYNLFNYNDHNTNIARLATPIQATVKIISTSSVELNKVFLLTIARSMVASGNKHATTQWLKSFIDNMAQSTPGVRDWSSYTLQHFPPSLQTCCNDANMTHNDINIVGIIHNEFSRILNVKHDLGKYYKENDTHCVFLSILLRKVMDTDVLPPYSYKVTSAWHPIILKKQIYNMLDFIISEAKNNMGNNSIFTKITNTLDDFIFRYKLFPLDTFLMIAILHKYTTQDAYISFFIIYNLLTKKSTMRERVDYFLTQCSPKFWELDGESSWANVHAMYHHQYPEHQYFVKTDPTQIHQGYLPIYYSNICLRFIPMLDLLVHRLIEVPVNKNSRSWLLDILPIYSGLYAHHDYPITYLHNTLYYYDTVLTTERDVEKRVLVRAILNAQHTNPYNALSPYFVNYVKCDDLTWAPGSNYYHDILMKLNNVIKNTETLTEFSHINWRYNEFGNAVCYSLYLVCVELMSIPISYTQHYQDPLSEHRLHIGSQLVDIVMCSKGLLPELANTLALIVSNLPASFSQAIYSKISDVLSDKSNFYEVGSQGVAGAHWNDKAQNCILLVHSFFQHCNTKSDKMSNLPDFLIKNMENLKLESQVIYILKLVSPFINHMAQIRSPVMNSTLRQLYQAIFNLMSETTVSNPDLFVDYLYYIKYLFVGDGLKTVIEKHSSAIPADISAKLRFLVQSTDVPPTT